MTTATAAVAPPTEAVTHPRFTVTHGALSRAFTLFDAAVGQMRRPMVPVLAGVKITATETDVTFEVSNSRRAAEVTIPADIGSTPGQVLIAAQPLIRFIRSMNVGTSRVRNADLPVTFASKDGATEVSAAGFTFTLPNMRLRDYPSPPEFDQNSVMLCQFKADRDEIARAAARASTAVGTDDTLPTLTGIKFELDHETNLVTLAATDRFRLAVAAFPAAIGVSGIGLVPAAGLARILRAMPQGELSVVINSDRLWIETSAVSVSLKLLKYEFVKFRSLFPDGHTTAFELRRLALLEAVARVSVATGRGHHLEMSFDGSSIVLSAGGSAIGSASSPPIPVSCAGAAPIRIALNPVFLGEMLRSFRSEMIALGMTTPSRPLVVAESLADLDREAGYRHLMMPARLPE